MKIMSEVNSNFTACMEAIRQSDLRPVMKFVYRVRLRAEPAMADEYVEACKQQAVAEGSFSDSDSAVDGAGGWAAIVLLLIQFAPQLQGVLCPPPVPK